jgi:glycosyltransferase involved in cell wall biosynthesis
MEIALQTNTSKWPEAWVVVLHGYFRDKGYLQHIMSVTSPHNVFLSTRPLDSKMLPELTSSADIGIALYMNLGVNFEYTIFSSGKIAQYLKCGLPILVNDFKRTVEIIDAYKCGVCIPTIDALPDALRVIEQNYAQYRENAFELFSLKYDFDNYFDEIMASIAELS